MIRVTIFNEYIQDQLDSVEARRLVDWDCKEDDWAKLAQYAREIRSVYPGGIHETLKQVLETDDAVEVRHFAFAENADDALSEAVLEDTDVLIWWAHVAHQMVPEATAQRVQQHVLRGMGLMVLHSGHLCRPMQLLLGTSCTLRWRDGDSEHLWVCNPRHPIARNVPECIRLETEEMYGEFFDIPAPDELIFLGNFQGGEVFRSGCVWNRGWGKLFYFQPGHETNTAYHNPDIQTILKNAVHYLAQPGLRTPAPDCIHAV